MALTRLEIDKLMMTAIVKVDAIKRDYKDTLEGELPETFPYQEIPDAQLLPEPTGQIPQTPEGLP